MDLYAYSQIDSLEELLKKNGIEIPRLRGLMLMKEEEKLSEEEINNDINTSLYYVARDWCCSHPRYAIDAECFVYDAKSDFVKKYYTDENNKSIRWERIHGKRRKNLKYLAKKKIKRIRGQYSVWNKYAGIDGVLYIHSRIGGGNWDYYGGKDIEKQPWFLEKVDDSFDSTYCDIYARITNI